MIKQLTFFLCIILISCYPARDISTMNMASDYRITDQYFHPEFTAFNETDSTVRLFFRVYPSEFLFVHQTDESFRAFFTMRTEVISSYENTQLIDTSSASFQFEISDKASTKVLSMNLPVKAKGNFLIHCYMTDQNKGFVEDFFIPLDRISKPSRQDFLVTYHSGVPLFRNYITPNDTVYIQYKDDGVSNFWGKFYSRDFPLAAPPFNFDTHTDFDYQPDSVFSLTRDQLNGIVFSREGFYHIQSDTMVKSGLSFFRFYSGFPDVATPKNMIESVRYLTNKKEFDDMKNAASPRSMIDNFWLTHGGNEEKSRALIKKYYGRVREANRYFTSYTEGWRSDRGMIYTIFGSPGTVFKATESETWIYGTPNSSLSLSFFFIKVNNPFTDNDFILSRSPSYENNWYRAVEVWRQGRAYNSFY